MCFGIRLQSGDTSSTSFRQRICVGPAGLVSACVRACMRACFVHAYVRAHVHAVWMRCVSGHFLEFECSRRAQVVLPLKQFRLLVFTIPTYSHLPTKLEGRCRTRQRRPVSVILEQPFDQRLDSFTHVIIVRSLESTPQTTRKQTALELSIVSDCDVTDLRFRFAWAWVWERSKRHRGPARGKRASAA
jgi:hypothetical protein